MARKETAPTATTRTSAILDEEEGIQDQHCASEKFKRLSRIRRTTILVHLRISRRINSREILWEKCYVRLAQSRWNRPPGRGRTRDGVSLVPGCFLGFGKMLGRLLLANVGRIPLPVQIFQELHLLERVAGAEQLQQGIFVFRSGFCLRVQFFGAGEQCAWRNF